MDRDTIFTKTLGHFLEPIQGLFDDTSVSEIMIIGPKKVYLERAGKLELSHYHMPSQSWLDALVQNIAEYVDRPLDADQPTLDGRLPDGSRIHVVIPPASRSGTCLTIRRLQHERLTIEELVWNASITAEVREFLGLAVAARRNIVISGGAGAGKTTLLSALAGLIPNDERIIVIEDTSEIQLLQPHVVYLEAQSTPVPGTKALTIRDLFVNALRMRPDRILIGEVRRGESLDLIQSMISGHAGSLTTVHASTPHDAASRLETMCLMSDTGMPIYVARAQVASALHLIVQIERLRSGRRVVTSVTECFGLDDNQRYQMNDLFSFSGDTVISTDKAVGELEWTGKKSQFADFMCTRGLANQIQLTRQIFE